MVTSSDRLISNSVVRFVSWNVKGLNGPVKRARVLSHLKSFNADILFLQETHLRLKDHIRLRKAWISQVYHSRHDGSSKGVAILINKKVQFTPTEIITDPYGRFVIISGCLYQTNVLLVNVYAPNWDDTEFVNKLLSSLPNLDTHKLILGGDLNCAINPTLDRSCSKRSSPSGMAKAFTTFMEQSGCIDPWRLLNPTLKRFSFFSPVYRSFSRIDYFFIDSSFIPSIKSVDYSTIIISDHSPVVLDISFALNIKQRPLWKLDPLILSDEDFCRCLAINIDVYISTNKKENTSYSLLWESLKAFLRGHIISYVAFTKREHSKEVLSLTDSIHKLDQLYSESPNAELHKKRIELQAKLNILTTKHAEQLLLKTRGTSYEYGDKCSRLLAHQLKRQTASRLIPQVKDELGILVSDPKHINDMFTSHFISLYSTDFPTDITPMTAFLNNIEAPSLDQTVVSSLERKLEIGEIIGAIMAMQNNKAPGVDGYGIEFYKKFRDQLAPLLLEVFNESLDRGSLPPTFSQASISLLLKKDKDPTHCGSYRPISLLNVDAKILAKVLAHRLEDPLPKIISEDQTGFIKGRHSFANIRRLIDIAYTKNTVVVPEAVISLDAEKAFDRVEWQYLFAALERFGFGATFIKWIKLLYKDPQACVQTNGLRSTFFHLTRGTRQGCPLSPLLFAIAIEPLAIALRTTSAFQGIFRGGVEHRVSLYADDLLIYASHPATIASSIVSILEEFGRFSGYKLNLQKSECFKLNSPVPSRLVPSFPFRLSEDGFKYLGIHITKSFTSLHASNLTTLVNQMKDDFKRWSALPLTLTGRINVVKMTVLPKFLYVFQCLPLFLTKSFFKTISQAVNSFIWGNQAPRVKKDLLQRQRCVGGLALPSFIHYYWAANIQKIVCWLHSPHISWCVLEEQSCKQSSLRALIYSSLPIRSSSFTSHPVVLSTLKIWNQFRSHYKFMSASTLGPIHKNHIFRPSIMDLSFMEWWRKGIYCFKDLYSSKTLDSYENLQRLHDLPRQLFFQYLQIRHFLKANFPSFPSLPEQGLWEDITLLKPEKGIISILYQKLLSLENHNLAKIQAGWEEELGMELGDYWDHALERVNSSSSCARLALIQFKVLHRAHYSKAKLAKIYQGADASCSRCSFSPANLTHTFWSCPSLETYWSGVFKMLSEALNITIDPSPLIAIFGVPTDTVTKAQSDVIAFTSLLARRRILLMWKSTTPPSSARWLEDVMLFLKLEKIKFTLRGSMKNFYRRGQPIIEYFDNLKELETGSI